MTDARAYDDQALPWLEAVESDEGPRAISARKMLVALVLVVIAAAVVAGTMFWVGRQDPAIGGAPELIRAQPGPYKVKPTDPGGLDVTGDSETAYSTSAGEDPDAALDIRKLPKEMEPVDPPQAAAAAPLKPARPEPAPTPKPAEEPAAGGPTAQLGAYGSTVKADTAWTLLSSRFPEVAALRKQVIAATVNGKPLYRLRVTGSAEAIRSACAALRAGGENCLVVN
ncbi:SPOR domain-containing protein [Sphingomonas xanthus]|uniref:SPOR domain-containing protein n=1 Tax=Sphingomonas xanthus TaxID=2594473 RepID=A0A516IQI6_9SPHN|nr:SPOR domain-containing protein [Sphingomonas xanthus]QDP19146.1 SPOR domain-containing protein [Sphingomonas xanthus]